MPAGLFLGVWYAGGIDFWRFRMPTSQSQTGDQQNVGQAPVSMQECISIID